MNSLPMISFNDGRAESAPTLRSRLRSRITGGEFLETRQKLFDAYWEFIYGAAVESGLGEREAEALVRDVLLDLAAELRAATPKQPGPLCARVIEITANHIHQFSDVAAQAPKAWVPVSRASLQEHWTHFQKKKVVKRAGLRVRARDWQAYSLHCEEGRPLRDVARTLQVNLMSAFIRSRRVARLVKVEAERLFTGSGL